MSSGSSSITSSCVIVSKPVTTIFVLIWKPWKRYNLPQYVSLLLWYSQEFLHAKYLEQGKIFDTHPYNQNSFVCKIPYSRHLYGQNWEIMLGINLAVKHTSRFDTHKCSHRKVRLCFTICNLYGKQWTHFSNNNRVVCTFMLFSCINQLYNNALLIFSMKFQAWTEHLYINDAPMQALCTSRLYVDLLFNLHHWKYCPFRSWYWAF